MQRLRGLLRPLQILALFADVRSALRFLRLRSASDAGTQPVELALRPLGGERILIRPATADVWAIGDTLLPPVHLPPADVTRRQSLRSVLDLGANIGLTMAHIAAHYPRARIVGVELDPDNAAICECNVAAWAQRCEVVNAAAWYENGVVRYTQHAGREMAFAAHPSDGEHSVPAMAVDDLVERAAVNGHVDYVKMDVEGAEAEILRRAGTWAPRVRTISVEVHAPYTTDRCRSDLHDLGFETRLDERGADASGGMPVVVGLRNGDR
jgi:FkbM family methyltransferase